jgi:glyoxylase-like metal-dependent hydrolase (beta-lactamase superfamily II)
VIASYLIDDAGERALVEIGPTSTLARLLAALESLSIPPESVSKLLVTHIHLDHAGAAGIFIGHFPQAQLFVHEVGAPHMIDPSKLLTSATRIYGDMMDHLWGAVEPVPADNVTPLTDGDTITIGNRKLTALYTPGHASHHVVYRDPARDAVFTGDVAAVRLQGLDYVRPPTPPPDLDIELWSRSLERLRALQARTLYLTHFGPFTDVESHLGQARERLYAWADLVAEAVDRGEEREQIIDGLQRHGDQEIIQATNDPSALERYELATPYGMTVDGLLRYFRKRQAAPR